jgi:hypothetical protein
LKFDDHELIVANVVGSFSYRPGVALSIVGRDADGFRLCISERVIDANNPSQKFEKKYHFTTGPFWLWTPDYLQKGIHSALVDFEAHEVDEWLRFDGERFKTPHKK